MDERHNEMYFLTHYLTLFKRHKIVYAEWLNLNFIIYSVLLIER